MPWVFIFIKSAKPKQSASVFGSLTGKAGMSLDAPVIAGLPRNF
jgi:hypothetical protein